MITTTGSGVLQYVEAASREVAELAKSAPEGHKTAAADLMWGISRLDSDKDGKISDEDLDMLVELAYGVTRDEIPERWKLLKESWRTYDGTLSVELILRDLSKGSVQFELARESGHSQFDPQKGGRLGPFTSLREYIKCFRDYDVDVNGVICSQDLRRAVLSKLGLDWSRQRCREIISKIDTDGDGVVGLNDFGLLIMQLVVEEEEGYSEDLEPEDDDQHEAYEIL